jgi:hypothetical protein
LLPLPIHVSYRDDPGSAVTQGVMEAALDYVGAAQRHRKNR